MCVYVNIQLSLSINLPLYHSKSICVHVSNILNFNVYVYMGLGTSSLHILIQHFLLCIQFVCIYTSFNTFVYVFN
jgi:uncharacterized integral membrane protein